MHCPGTGSPLYQCPPKPPQLVQGHISVYTHGMKKGALGRGIT